MNPQPVAYIRRSVARRTDPGDVSREFQTDKVRSLANGDGPTLRIVDADWGISADREKTHKRLAFLDMLASVERGEVSTIYAFALDRLARSVQWSARLLDACEDAGTIVVTGEGRFDPTDDRDRQMFHFYAMQNEGALRAMKKKAQASVATRRNRGDVIGPRPYGEVRTRRDGVVVGTTEDAALVVATFREAGSYFAAARLLNDRKVSARSGGPWYPRTVQRIVNREDRTTIPLGHRRGVRSVGSRPLSGLLRCHCSAIMGQTTSNWSPKYRCPNGVADPSHPRPYMVSERKLLDWVKAEAARFDPHREGVVTTLGDRDDERRVAIIEQRRKLALGFARGGLDDATYEVEDAALATDLAAIDARGALVDIPPGIRWTAEGDLPAHGPQSINTILRTYWDAVQLGPDLQPVRAEWRLPSEWIIGA